MNKGKNSYKNGKIEFAKQALFYLFRFQKG